jgi:Glycoside hydrolase 97/Glycosyl hydrolase family 9/Glycosyl-hydrolase 97 N-terminal/Glycosyl-hydrolase 97 C-terminal, oligomerisation/Cellulase N-terminal ig-like domain
MRIAVSIAITLLLSGLTARALAQKDKVYDLASPGGATRISVTVGAAGLVWTVSHGGQAVLAPSALALQLDGGETLDGRSGPAKAVTATRDERIAALHYKKDSVQNRYRQLTLNFPAGRYGIVFRAYDDGAAYRWVTQRRDSLKIGSEKAEFNFPADEKAWIPYVNDPSPDIYTTSFENLYRTMRLSEFKRDTLAFLPVLVDLGNERKAGILEADLEDYPGMFLGAGSAAGGSGLAGRFAPYPLEEHRGGHNQLQSLVTRRADYLAVTAGTRSFPWRIVVCSDQDRELADNDMVYRLASPSRVTDTSWIKPGKVAWDWWNDWNISHVDFRAGINTETYKYYIDFAADNHLGYILLDEGWSDPTDLLKIAPGVDLAEIVRYGKERNVGVWLWAGMLPLDEKMDEVMGRYSQMGIRGFKVDFMNRDDQKMVRFYYRAAEKAAADHLMLDFHGAYKPTGLQRTFPNVLNFEGVRGMENAKWAAGDDFPGYDVSIPFIRMLAGPLDYTPGAMKNYNKANFRSIFGEPMSAGTRCHQLAMYVVYEAPFSMLSDNPTNYKREPESVAFMAGVPTVFDETRALDGEVGHFVAIARRKGADWWVGAMTDWSARDLTLDLSFLPAGSYRAEIIRDGINADRDGTDFKLETVIVSKDSKLTIHLAPGGGWVAKITRGGNAVATPAPAPATPAPMIDINQVGFYPTAPKLAVVTGTAGVTGAGDRFFVVTADAGDTVFAGQLGLAMTSANSSLSTRLADFTALKIPGRYCVVLPGIGLSYPFRVAADVLYPVVTAALKGYYYQRSGVVLTPEYAGQWSRPAGHPDTQVLVHPSAATASRPAGTVISTPGGWYDAGDYNKYIVNSGITMGTLLDAYEDFPRFFDTLHTHIPPMAGVPDLLNEVLYNLRWMLTMQDPADGGVYHKCTNAVFDGMVMPGVTKAPRYVVQKGTAATLDFAAVMAQAARILRKFQRPMPGLADSCLHAAKQAWTWAFDHPDSIYDQLAMNRTFLPPVTTGAYGDRNFDDELFWAAAELMVTTRDDKYFQVVRMRIDKPMTLPSWSNVRMMGDYTLLRFQDSLPVDWRSAMQRLRQRFLSFADSYVDKISSNAFHAVIGESRSDFIWGSNAVAANQGMLLVNAWLQTKDRRYLAPALANLDYLLGMNATGYCFITGIGTHSTMHPHHRPSISDGIDEPVPGLMAGGPNPGQQDHQRYAFSEPETSYTDQGGAYASNEIAINWNAPLVYLAGAMVALEGQFR